MLNMNDDQKFRKEYEAEFIRDDEHLFIKNKHIKRFLQLSENLQLRYSYCPVCGNMIKDSTCEICEFEYEDVSK